MLQVLIVSPLIPYIYFSKYCTTFCRVTERDNFLGALQLVQASYLSVDRSAVVQILLVFAVDSVVSRL